MNDCKNVPLTKSLRAFFAEKMTSAECPSPRQVHEKRSSQIQKNEMEQISDKLEKSLVIQTNFDTREILKTQT